jgi:putative transposase
MRACQRQAFEIVAYVLMPDHLHVLVEGARDDSDFVKWLNLFRQLSAYWERKRSGNVLWQEGYWDYTLRDDDAVAGIASYIAWNPVEAGLVASPEQYPHIGSERFSVCALAMAPQVKPRTGDF